MQDYKQGDHMTNDRLTVLPVIQNFKVLLGSDGQRLLDHCDGVLRGERTIEELASSWSLHNLGTTVAR